MPDAPWWGFHVVSSLMEMIQAAPNIRDFSRHWKEVTKPMTETLGPDLIFGTSGQSVDGQHFPHNVMRLISPG